MLMTNLTKDVPQKVIDIIGPDFDLKSREGDTGNIVITGRDCPADEKFLNYLCRQERHGWG